MVAVRKPQLWFHFAHWLRQIRVADRYGKALSGERKANAIMKCETKAKRRATLALCGIPWTEAEAVIPSKIYDPSVDRLPEDKMAF